MKRSHEITTRRGEEMELHICLTPLFSLTVLNFVLFFSSYRIGILMRILKLFLKQSFSYSKRVLYAILSLTLYKLCFLKANFDTAFLLDCTNFFFRFCSFSCY